MKLPSVIASCTIALCLHQPVHADTLYVTQLNSGEITKVDSAGAQTVFATGLSGPKGIAVDQAGFIYVVDANPGRISNTMTPGAARFLLLSPRGHHSA